MTTKESAAARMADHERHAHCGCCGRCFLWLNGVFCLDCTQLKDHLGAAYVRGAPVASWDRTYEATHGKPCPFTEISVLPT